MHNGSAFVLSFEELVSRESASLQALGLFSRGERFNSGTGPATFRNVYKGMDTARVTEYEGHLSLPLQDRALDATRLASLFFADIAELSNFETSVGGEPFEPMTYLLRHQTLLEAGVDPMRHSAQRIEHQAPRAG